MILPTNPLDVVKNQLDISGKLADIPTSIIEQLKNPRMVVEVSVPIRMDNGNIVIFNGYRVQHNPWRGPYKGGVRYHPQVSLDDQPLLPL